MKISNVVFSGVLVLLGACSAEQNLSHTSRNPGATNLFAESNNRFAFDLNRALQDDYTGKNVFISPASMSMAFAMLYNGSESDTKSQLAKTFYFEDASVFGLNGNKSDLNQRMQYALNTWTATKASQGYDLKLANQFFAQKDFGWLESYTKDLATYYNSGVLEYDFRDFCATECPRAIKDINQWAADNTNDRINDIVNENNINADTRFALANAIYFNADWSIPFPKYDYEQKMNFTVEAGKTISVNSMSNDSNYKYMENDEVQMVEMTYASPAAFQPELSMLVLLPQENSSVDELVKNLNVPEFNSWVAQLSDKYGFVQMPLFEQKMKFELQELLEKKMGLDIAMSKFADYSAMNGRKDISIGAVLHDTFIKVDQKGTEAAAVTVITGLEATSVGPSPEFMFNANRPFVYIIRDIASGTILFVGQQVDPSVK
ncbi:MAG: serpin family protein [Oligoflexales bacterium]|nr:serpin family protein [Oligoflexales bacterium]